MELFQPFNKGINVRSNIDMLEKQTATMSNKKFQYVKLADKVYALQQPFQDNDPIIIGEEVLDYDPVSNIILMADETLLDGSCHEYKVCDAFKICGIKNNRYILVGASHFVYIIDTYKHTVTVSDEYLDKEITDVGWYSAKRHDLRYYVIVDGMMKVSDNKLNMNLQNRLIKFSENQCPIFENGFVFNKVYFDIGRKPDKIFALYQDNCIGVLVDGDLFGFYASGEKQGVVYFSEGLQDNELVSDIEELDGGLHIALSSSNEVILLELTINMV